MNRKLGVARARVFDSRIEMVLLGNMLVILILIRGVDAQEVMIVGNFVDQNIIDETTVRIEQSRVLGLAELELGRVVHRDVLHQIERLRTAHFDLAHVADVE